MSMPTTHLITLARPTDLNVAAARSIVEEARALPPFDAMKAVSSRVSDITGHTTVVIDRNGAYAGKIIVPESFSEEASSAYLTAVNELRPTDYSAARHFIERGCRVTSNDFHFFHFMGNGLFEWSQRSAVVGAIIVDQPTNPREADMLSRFLGEMAFDLGSIMGEWRDIKNDLVA